MTSTLQRTAANAVALVLGICAVVFAPVVYAEDLTPIPCENCDSDAERSLLDSSHGYVTQQFDAFARWIDGAFGTRREEAEAANSFVRLQLEERFAEHGEANARVRVRGKVRLPLLNERVKLVFFDEDDSQIAGDSLEDVETESANDAGVGLQYNIADQRKFRLDYRLGARSGYQLRTGVRARYSLPLGDESQIRLTENVYWQATRGFGSKTVIDLEHLLSDRQLLRLSSSFDFTEEDKGVPWTSVLSFRHVYKRDHAVAFYIRADGETRPEYITEDYGPGLLYRLNVFKKWLFFEFEPTYRWTRDPITYERDHEASVTLRLEVMFSEEHLE